MSDNGTNSMHFPIAALMDNIHVLTVCDLQPGFPFLPSPCPAAATHADGSLVSSTSPATAGETIVLYAYGWEPQYPRSKLEALLRLPPPVLGNGPLKVQFDFRPNARASIPYLGQGKFPLPNSLG